MGDNVVYSAHGAGRITAREIREVRGEQQVVIVLALAHGLSVELPLSRAEELLRPLAGAEEIVHLGIVLRSDAPSIWIRGSSDNARRAPSWALRSVSRKSSTRPRGVRRSLRGKGELVRRAKDLLAVEIALSRGEDSSVASAWIEEQLLALTPRRPAAFVRRRATVSGVS